MLYSKTTAGGGVLLTTLGTLIEGWNVRSTEPVFTARPLCVTRTRPFISAEGGRRGNGDSGGVEEDGFGLVTREIRERWLWRGLHFLPFMAKELVLADLLCQVCLNSWQPARIGMPPGSWNTKEGWSFRRDSRRAVYTCSQIIRAVYSFSCTAFWDRMCFFLASSAFRDRFVR